MKKILVAYDGTPGAEQALTEMLRAGLPQRAEAKVLTIADVWLPPTTPEGTPSDDPHYFASHQHAKDALREAGDLAVEGARRVHELFPNWNVSNSANADSPAWGIVAEAKRWGADLIVIGSHGRNPLEKFFLGSISFKVAAEAECSVRVTRPREHSGRAPQVMVAMDGSADSQRAAEEVLHRHWPPNTEIQLVAVIDEKVKTSFFRFPSQGSTAPEANAPESVKTMLEQARARFSERQLTAHTHIFEGDPKSTMLRQAAKWDVDAIFLGARGMEHGNRLYLGTVASAICTRAHCSVEIVRPKPSSST
jgi:nucleotide-binding universal stress UspA family protein